MIDGKNHIYFVDKNSNTKVSDAYKKWSPYHRYGYIWNGWSCLLLLLDILLEL